MKNYATKSIRNIVLLGGTRSGKTTFAETMMFEGKVIDRRGTVEAKTTVSDNTEVEQLYQRSIYATPLYAEFMDHKLNIIDAPGADDYIGGLISAFKVCDAGIMVVNAQQGVESVPRSTAAMPRSTRCPSPSQSTSSTPTRPTGTTPSTPSTRHSEASR